MLRTAGSVGPRPPVAPPPRHPYAPHSAPRRVSRTHDERPTTCREDVHAQSPFRTAAPACAVTAPLGAAALRTSHRPRSRWRPCWPPPWPAAAAMMTRAAARRRAPGEGREVVDARLPRFVQVLTPLPRQALPQRLHTALSRPPGLADQAEPRLVPLPRSRRRTGRGRGLALAAAGRHALGVRHAQGARWTTRKPDGETIGIGADPRKAARRGAKRIGSLAVQLRRPRRLGRRHAARLRPRLRRSCASRYDLVSFDPRGVGEQRGRALPGRRRRSTRTSPPTRTPDNAAEEKRRTSRTPGRLRRGLREDAPAKLLPHLTTATPPATWT